MTLEILLTYLVIALALLAMAREWLAPDLVLVAALGVLIAAGVVELESALRGFAEPTLLALGSLFVVAAGLQHTGALRKAAHLLLGGARRESGALLRLTSAVAAGSAFLNNTPIVAMGIPATLSWTRQRGLLPSRFLIPLSYASILGGVCTLIGTSTNLVADGMLRARDMPGLGFFELSALGVPLALAGLAYLVFVAPRLLAERAHVDTAAERGTVARDIHLVRVPEGSRAVGRRIAEIDLGRPQLRLMRMVRADGAVVQIAPEAALRAGDRLTFRGDPSVMNETVRRIGLERVVTDRLPDQAEGADLCEAVVAEGSKLVGERVRDPHFVDRYDSVVLGVVRDGREVGDLEGLRLRPGDVLLLVARPEFGRNFADSRHLYLLSGREIEDRESDEGELWAPGQARIGLAILLGVVGLATFGVAHISVAALGGAVLMVVFRLLSASEARRSIDWSVLIVIGAAIGLGAALESSGGAALLAEGIAAAGAPLGPRGVLASLLVATMLLTLTITNNAAVAIVIPVAVELGSGQGLDTRPLVIAVTVGASLAFATPLGYQTNLMVYGPGGYGFGDFVRAGLPLQLLAVVLAVVLIPWIWPF